MKALTVGDGFLDYEELDELQERSGFAGVSSTTRGQLLSRFRDTIHLSIEAFQVHYKTGISCRPREDCRPEEYVTVPVEYVDFEVRIKSLKRGEETVTIEPRVEYNPSTFVLMIRDNPVYFSKRQGSGFWNHIKEEQEDGNSEKILRELGGRIREQTGGKYTLRPNDNGVFVIREKYQR